MRSEGRRPLFGGYAKTFGDGIRVDVRPIFLLNCNNDASLPPRILVWVLGIRHISTPTLWLQAAVSDGKVRLSKIAGAMNPSDLGTKHVDRPIIDRALAQCGFVSLHGRSAKALSRCVV